MAQRVVLHVGQPKTGSSSIQQYVFDHQSSFLESGISLCLDWNRDLSSPTMNSRSPANSKFIANAIIRDSLATAVRIRRPDAVLSAKARDDGIKRVNAFLKELPGKTALLSAEVLAHLRDEDEFLRIEQLCAGLEFSALMFLREPVSWLKSYKTQITYTGLIDHPRFKLGEGIGDLSPQSWMINREAMERFWRGRCKFISYEAALSEHGSVVPAFIHGLGVDPSSFPSWSGYYSNQSKDKM